MFLIDDILILPAKGFFGIFKKIHEMAEQEFSDEMHIRERLMELQLRFEFDEIGEEEYNRHEKELLGRLNSTRGVNDTEREEGKNG